MDGYFLKHMQMDDSLVINIDEWEMYKLGYQCGD